jgi:primosomal protein N' (replication factor Y)
LGYPPFASMIRLVIRGPSERTAHTLAEELGRRLTQQSQNAQPAIRVLGPAPAPIARLRGYFRYQIQLQSSDGESLRGVVRRATADLKPGDDTAWIVDVDPLDMM